MVSSLLAGIRFPSLINEGLDARGTDPNENADPPQKPGRKLIGMPAGFISEWWPASNRNGGRLQVGIPGRNKSESAFTKWWTQYRKDIGVYKKTLDYHSFRGGVTTKLSAANISLDVRNELLGHEGQSIDQQNYLKGLPLRMLADAIACIEWPEVTIGRTGIPEEAKG
jgi:hypothetical protein